MPKVPVWTLVIAGGVAILLYLRFADRPPPVYIPGPTSFHTVYKPTYYPKLETQLVPVHGQVEFFKPEAVAKQLKSQDAPDNVIAVGEVPPHTGRTTVLATLAYQDNVYRGSLTYRQEPPPFFDLKLEGGLRGGYGTEGVMGEAYIRPLRIGPLNIEGRAYGHSKDSEFGAAILGDIRF